VPVKGTFREISGDGTVSPAGEIRGALRVAAASIDTNNALRDRHLRSADFFDADSHPAITYEVKSVQPSGQKVTVTGTLTVRDRALSLSFEASVAVQNDSELRIYADVRIHRADPGLTWSGLGTSMLNALTVHAVFSRR
jgi:polyisoprenoid-binding protein YceI